MISEGAKVPELTLIDHAGKSAQLSTFKGKKVVLYFYPEDDTPGCTKEACAFRDNYAIIQKTGAEILGGQHGRSKRASKISPKIQSAFPALGGRQSRSGQSLWRVRSKELVRQEILGHRAINVYYRCGGLCEENISQGESRWARTGGAGGVKGFVVVLRRKQKLITITRISQIVNEQIRVNR